MRFTTSKETRNPNTHISSRLVKGISIIVEESNEMLINNDDILKIVYLENNVPAGYIAVYTKDDFCKLENFPDKIGKEENVAYIWEIVTDKNYMGKGIASKLMQYVLEKFKGYKIYSCIAKDNIPSLKLHEKYGFKEAYQFTNDKEQLMLLKNN